MWPLFAGWLVPRRPYFGGSTSGARGLGSAEVDSSTLALRSAALSRSAAATLRSVVDLAIFKSVTAWRMRYCRPSTALFPSTGILVHHAVGGDSFLLESTKMNLSPDVPSSSTENQKGPVHRI